MKGHLQILRARKAGIKPKSIYFRDTGAASRLVEQEMRHDIDPSVYACGCDPVMADLRFVVGLPVHLWATDPDRSFAWSDALLKAGASIVYDLRPNGDLFTWRN